MSVKVMTMVFDRYPNGGGEMLTALALADHASDDGSKVFPSVASLAAKTRQSERTIQYQLRHMEQIGWLQLVSHEFGGRSKTREYRINPAWINGDQHFDIDLNSKGANSAPIEKGAIYDTKGCNPRQERVQSTTVKGAIAVAPESSVTIIEPSITVIPRVDAEFDEFWKFYPKKTGKLEAMKSWKKVKPNLAQVLQALRWQVQSDQWTRNGGQYVPNPSTYINQGRWLDEPAIEGVF